jgi:serine protease
VSAQSWLWEIPQGLEAGFRWPGYAEGELLVKFRERLASDDRARAARDEGDVLEETITPDGLVKVRLGAGRSVVGSIDRWSARGDVEYATVNLRARGFFTPNDTVISTFDLGWNLRSVGAYDAWDVGTGDPSVVLAIIDSGVAFEDHEIPPYEREFVKPDVTMYRRSPDLPGPFLPGWDFVHDDGHPNDDNGHGTNVATVAAGAANNVAGSAGIAFGVTILPVKVLDYRNDSSMEWIVAGIRFAADHGAHIANLSLGFPPIGLFRLSGFPENVIAHMFKPLHDAVSYAQRRGTILVAASGNFNASEVSPPAAYPGVIAVGASNVDNRRSSYSSFGRALDFVAPGGDFTELNGDQVQDGVAVLSIKPHRSEGSLANPDSFNVFVFFGTSAAAPHVAGAVALLMSRGLTKQGAIEQTLRATAIHPFALKPGSDPEYGAGLIQIDAAMRDLVPAHGLNLARALDTSARPSVRLLSGNPARGGASLALRVLRPGPVRVRVFDVSGALVRSLLDGDAPAGERVLRWDGRTTGGAAAGSGIYFFRIETADGAVTRKVAFLR